MLQGGQEYLALMIVVDDPQYLQQPYVKTCEYKKQARRLRMEPRSLFRQITVNSQ